jgi:Fe-S-cluster containining protein
MDVIVDRDKRIIFRDQDTRTLHLNACPFLRFDTNGKALCSIHNSRPELCRMYSCFRLLVVSPEGKHIGRVQDGSRFFFTMDTELRRIWQDKISCVTITDETLWEKYVEKVFTQAGYRIVR